MVTITRTPGASANLNRAITEISKKQLRVGWFDTSRYADGTPVAYVATIQEFGHGAIPARPFMRPTVADKTTEWKSALAAGAYQVMNGRLTVDEMLGQVGDVAVGNIRETIESIDTPPLSNITLLLRQKKKDGERISGRTVGNAAAASGFLPSQGAAKSLGVSDKPLIDTGLMFQSVTHKVENV